MQLIKNFANYVLQSRKNAILAAIASRLIPFVNGISPAIPCLVVLRKGPKEGGLVMLWSMLPIVLVLWFSTIRSPQSLSPVLWIYSIVGTALLPYLLAIILRKTASWSVVMQTATILSVVAIVLIHLIVPDIQALWLKQNVLPKNILTSVDKVQITWIVKFATGIQAAALIMTTLIQLLIARGIQASVFNPGQLRPELLSIRLDKTVVLLALSLILAAAFNITFAQDCLPPILLMFGLASVSLLHASMTLWKLKPIWFSVAYLFIIVSFLYFQFLILLLIALTCLDSFFNIRLYLSTKFQ
jgi:hypothetical protein